MYGTRKLVVSVLAYAGAALFFLVPFAFVALTAMKSRQEASLLQLSWPSEIHLIENLIQVIQVRDFMIVRAFFNSAFITVFSVTLIVIFSAMVGFVLNRRKTSWNKMIGFLVLSGLMIPPAIVPTIWLLQELGIFRTLHSMVLIQVAYNISFGIILYRAFFSTIPRELDEAAIMDGAGPVSLFFKVMLPLLKPVTVTNIVVLSVVIFNDFVHPLYYLPGDQNVTIQLTLYNFQSMYNTSYNLLFTNILVITIPMLIVFLFFNRQIVSGMTSGAIKG
ncbi:carbohydrate ABC transporter permease [Natronospirillum operosum]|uniref:Carbohydrate ABC transporter permease n=1 Tax=Natronospirillum operosum TaxID=2759953 RepID=A0A4Z0WAW6_9GAMM|nr:carbohydrate ABC transporter permease [Natronospirillum operosum]TGG93505.1 carbohydrate ABC transporter permease [Natronospirillum operosum]